MEELKYKKIKFPNYKKFMESKAYTEKHYTTRYNEFSGESYSKLISKEYERNVVKGSYAIRLDKIDRCIVAFIDDTPCEYYVNDEIGYEQAVEYLNKRHFNRCEQLLIDYKF